jgi:hypothetical protein
MTYVAETASQSRLSDVFEGGDDRGHPWGRECLAGRLNEREDPESSRESNRPPFERRGRGADGLG